MDFCTVPLTAHTRIRPFSCLFAGSKVKLCARTRKKHLSKRKIAPFTAESIKTLINGSPMTQLQVVLEIPLPTSLNANAL